MNKPLLNTIVNPLLSWYYSSARVLPWRDNPTPYRVWVSEIMLQQTRVDTVLPYFERFVAALPDIASLAQADEQQLLKLWEGLGYYSRVKNMQKAALTVMKLYNGKLPASFEALKELPGIGAYSAGAISSIAFGLRFPAVDGNVLRVISRITASADDITDIPVKKRIEQQVTEILPTEAVGDFNQSLMELGATVCLPNGAPRCDICPLKHLCLGFEHGIAAELPVKTVKAAKRAEAKTVLVMVCGDKLGVTKRKKTGLLAGMWELPNIDGALSMEECITVVKDMGLSVNEIQPLTEAKHIFTHIMWNMMGYLLQVNEARNDSITWVSPKDLKERMALPTAFKAYIRHYYAYLNSNTGR
ncbi:A/G-specific adenine glycosylase [Acetanaerobacterium elongatum]|uniref:Adenine DNA glycosylase n=1 Tax=Acetanaerobacterium elongatum TaxID=258515 RepID=A0A1H0B3Q1_9FIRM|nr:A/G-specific adenine glycosylase [Acetanaerobacterium elongatum]SDN40270.1 A/G-specific DNA-adenine glycosylase [Acetanaerobacterium elongatum]